MCLPKGTACPSALLELISQALPPLPPHLAYPAAQRLLSNLRRTLALAIPHPPVGAGTLAGSGACLHCGHWAFPAQHVCAFCQHADFLTIPTSLDPPSNTR